MNRKRTRFFIFTALLTAGAVILNSLDMLLPTPVPNMRIGIAHVMTIIAVYVIGLRGAGLVILFKLIISALLWGKFGTPGFFIALAGNAATFSFLVIGKRFLSIIPLSVGAAFFNNLGQFAVVFFFFIPHLEILWLFAILLAIGCFTGTIIGITAQQLLRRIGNGSLNN